MILIDFITSQEYPNSTLKSYNKRGYITNKHRKILHFYNNFYKKSENIFFCY